jgi:acetamidase/formamidase
LLVSTCKIHPTNSKPHTRERSMEMDGFEMTTEEKAAAEEIRMIDTLENRTMAAEIRAMLASSQWEPMDPKFYARREQYAFVYHYMQLNIL